LDFAFEAFIKITGKEEFGDINDFTEKGSIGSGG